MDTFKDLVTKITPIWMRSEPCQRLQSTLRERAKDSPRIRRIVCFNLGPVRNISESPEGHDRVFKYLAAVTTAETLVEVYEGTESPPLPVVIFAQDEHYDEVDKQILICICPCIRAIPYSRAFLLTDQHTLIIDGSAPNDGLCSPAFEAIARSGDPSHRPGAIIATDITLDGDVGELNGRYQPTPEVLQMLEEYDLCNFADTRLDESVLDLLEDKSLKRRICIEDDPVETMRLMRRRAKIEKGFWLSRMRFSSRRAITSERP